MKVKQRNLDVKKATIFAIVINAMQVVLVIVVALYLILPPAGAMDMILMRYIVVLAAMVVAWGGIVDIREALSTRHLLGQLDDMDHTIEAMEGLNNSLRAQRHDFLNHLQVVYSLMEMEEYQEADAYIEKVYGAITSLSRVMRTANPSVNALLRIKVAACEKAGVQVTLNIQSAWRDLSIPGWEMCKVLSNLIDNAIDALQEVTDRRLTLTLTEDLRAFRFSVANNGPMIPVHSLENIFLPGITSKAAGHGMGLYIVRQTLRRHGGDITVASDAGETVFSGFVPKEITMTKPVDTPDNPPKKA